MLLARRGSPYLFAVFDIRKQSACGHTLRVEIARISDADALPWDERLNARAALEDTLRRHPFCYHGNDEPNADPNLVAYRRIVLSLDATR